MKQTVSRITLVAILTFTNSSVVWADHAIEQADVSWFSSNTSSLLNRSSIELATKHLGRGIYYAHQALEKNLNPMDELIANHNLCIGYLASNESVVATRYCTRAHELAQASYNVVKIRGALQLQENDVNDNLLSTLTPAQVIASNIQLQNAETQLTLLIN